MKLVELSDSELMEVNGGFGLSVSCGWNIPGGFGCQIGFGGTVTTEDVQRALQNVHEWAPGILIWHEPKQTGSVYGGGGNGYGSQPALL